MLRVTGVTNAHLEAQQVNGTTYDVEWVDIDEPLGVLHTAPGQPVTTTNDQALIHVASQGWAQGAAYFSRLEGQVYDDGVVYFTSTQGGGAAEAEPNVAPDPNGFGRGSGQVWAYDTRTQKLRVVFQSPEPVDARLPGQHHHVAARHARGLRGQHRATTSSAGCPRTGRSGTSRSTGCAAAPRQRGPLQRRVRGVDVQPDGNTLFVNIQASRGMTFAIWGPWPSIGV